MQNELQNAFAMSQIERAQQGPDEWAIEDAAKVKSLFEAGRFVVLHNYYDHCSRTDTVIGSQTAYAADFETYEEALEWDSEEYCCEGCSIATPEGFVPPAPDEDEGESFGPI